jgi:DNA polymerase-3 subunit epsilon
MRQIILDTETTGLEPELGHRIIEIGAVELIDRQFTGRQLHLYLNPERDIDSGALEVHGITLEFLADKPLFADKADEFLEFVKDSELVIHNAPFDIGFLDYELSLLERGLSGMSEYAQVLDTLELAKDLHPGQRNNLDALCKRYEIDNSSRTLHGALLDAEILAHVYLAMTGGQTDLGLSLDKPVVTDHDMDSGPELPPASVRVLRATDAEWALHNARKESIRETAGDCEFDRLDEPEPLYQ